MCNSFRSLVCSVAFPLGRAILLYVALLPILLHTISSPVHAQAPVIKWENTYGGQNDEVAQSIARTSDGGFIVAGWTNSINEEVVNYHGGLFDVWVVKIDSLGKLEWSTTYGGTGDEQAYSIVQTFDGGYIFAGITNSNDGDLTGFLGGNYDVWVVKLDHFGTIEWNQLLGGSGDDRAYSIIQTADSGYAIAGFSNSIDGQARVKKGKSDYWIVKMDPKGKIQWKDDVGGSQDDIAYSIVQTFDHGYAVSGVTESKDGDVTGFHSLTDFWIVRLDSLGTMKWNKAYGGSGSEIPFSMVQTKDSGFAIAGFTNSSDGDVTSVHGIATDYWVIKIDSLGGLQWQKTFGGSKNEFATSIVQTEDGGYAVGGYANSVDGDVIGIHTSDTADYWLLKLNAAGTMEWQRTLGGTLEDEEESLVETPSSASHDAGYVLAGYSASTDGDVKSAHGNKDFWVVDLEQPCFDIRVALQPAGHPSATIKARNQDTVSIPIYALDTSVRSVSSFDFSLAMNTDVLTPIGIEKNQGEFASSTTTSFDAKSKDSLSVRLQLASPQKVRIGLLCVVKCIAYLTDTLSTPIAITRASFADSVSNGHCITAQIQSSPDTTLQFALLTECGDSIISKALAHESFLSIESITPNPTPADIVVRFHVPSNYPNDGILEVEDELGNVLLERPLLFSSQSARQSVSISLPSGSGVRYLRIASVAGVSTKRVVLRR